MGQWVRGQAKDGPGRAAHRDTAPDGRGAARDPSARAIDRGAQSPGEVGAEKLRPRDGAWCEGEHVAAEPWTAHRERKLDEREASAHAHQLPQETGAEGGLAGDPEPSAGGPEDRDGVAGDEEPALAASVTLTLGLMASRPGVTPTANTPKPVAADTSTLESARARGENTPRAKRASPRAWIVVNRMGSPSYSKRLISSSRDVPHFIA
jgi:hypothetical protein